MELKTPLSSVLRTTGAYLEALERSNVRTVEDLLEYLPRRHEDLRDIHTIETAPLGEKVTLRGTLHAPRTIRTRGGKSLVSAMFVDGNGDTAEVLWFNQPHVKRMIREGAEVSIAAKLQMNGRRLQLLSPQWEHVPTGGAAVHGGRLVPVYPEHDILTTKWLREKFALIREAAALIAETLPEDVVKEQKLLSRSEAIAALHFANDPALVERARDRVAFEQMYTLQEEALRRKMAWQGQVNDRLRTPMHAALIRALFASLKFTPTESQRIAIYEILRDMEKDIPMSRLLEGDVGSGKTLVATAVMANVILENGQTALMVPTEVLARQHAENLLKLLHALHRSVAEAREEDVRNFPPPNVALLTGSTLASEAEKVKQGIARGTVDVVVGTHALLEADVAFRDLRLVIIDEQHRFGVEQRRRLVEKGTPHFLAMTATPIPRTLALTAFGDHDLSVLLEKPGRRQPIETRVVPPSGRRTVELFIDREIEEGRQVFVICPLITEGEDDRKNVESETRRLKEAFPHRRIAMLHGKLPAAEKQQVMEAFKAKHFDILVSTSVIEVGIDVPNATIMIIEGAERFGLSQLHQLRGRVGRGEHKSHCFLFPTDPAQARSPRLKAMEQHESGFLLAEMDLQLRGPGDLYGLRQSGLALGSDIRFFQPELIVRARAAAEKALGIPSSKALKAI